MHKFHFECKAPSRADIAGGTLDLWPLYNFLDGPSTTLNLALSFNARVILDVQPLGKETVLHLAFQSERCTLEYPYSLRELEAVPKIFQLPASLFRCLLQLPSAQELRGAAYSLSWSSQVPMGSGLGGSSALSVALLKCVGHAGGLFTSPGWEWELLRLAQDAEAMLLRMPTGTQDYLAALFGGLNAFTSQAGSLARGEFAWSLAEELGRHLLLVFSGQSHESGLSNWDIYRRAVEKDADVLRGLERLRKIADDVKQVLKRDPLNFAALGDQMRAEWAVRRDLFRVNTPTLEALVQAAERQPILGYKVCGAAQGGTMAVLVDPGKKEAVARGFEGENWHVLEGCVAQQEGVVVCERNVIMEKKP